jgi:hypothetical protein
MRLRCPACGSEIGTEGVNVAANVAHCAACGETHVLSRLAGAEADREAPSEVPRPKTTRVEFQREEGRLAVALPRGAHRGAGCLMLFFSAFWNAITWAIVATIVAGLLSGGKGGVGAFGLFGLLFMIPFVLVGIATALAALYLLFGRAGFAMSGEKVLLRRSLFGFTHQRSFNVADVTRVGVMEAYRQNDEPVHGVGLKIRGRATPLVFGTNLSDEERDWLAWEVYSFWRQARERAG